MDNVGQHMHSAEIWIAFIEFEMSLNHLGFVGLLGYLALKTPLVETGMIEER